MYHYELVTVEEVVTSPSSGDVQPITFLTAQDDKVDNDTYYLRLDKTRIHTEHQVYTIPDYFFVSSPDPIQEGQSFYMALLEEGGRRAALVTPEVFFKTKRHHLDDAVHKTGEGVGLTSEETFMKLFYLEEDVFFEHEEDGVATIFPKVFHRMFYTREEEAQFTIHREPLVYPVSPTHFLFVTNTELDNDCVRLMKIAEGGSAVELAVMDNDSVVDTLKENNGTLRDFIAVRKAIKDIKQIQDVTLEL